jgi:hypothetical protein
MDYPTLNRKKHEPFGSGFAFHNTPAEGERVAAVMAEAVERCARHAR